RRDHAQEGHRGVRRDPRGARGHHRRPRAAGRQGPPRRSLEVGAAVYATVAELRAEGVTVAQADDARLAALIDAATAEIDRVTGWFFEPRDAQLVLDGRGAPSLELPVPPIRLDELVVGGAPASLDPADLVIVGAPIRPSFDAPRLTRRH